MIYFYHNKDSKDIEINIFSSLINGKFFSLKFSQHEVYQAKLLCEHLDKEMNLKLENIRKQSYEQGWKDAKSKKKKQGYFNLGWYDPK